MALHQTNKDARSAEVGSKTDRSQENRGSRLDPIAAPENAPAHPAMYARMMQLQKTAGNQAVAQLLKAQMAAGRRPIQRAESAGRPIQRAESPEHSIQRAEGSDRPIQRTESADHPIQRTVFHAQGDHVFNDIPGALNAVDERLQSPVLTEMSAALKGVRDAAGTVDCPTHEDDDDNSVEFGQARLAFRNAATAYADNETKKNARAMTGAADQMWARSVDLDTRAAYPNKGNWDRYVERWNGLREGAKGALKDHRS